MDVKRTKNCLGNIILSKHIYPAIIIWLFQMCFCHDCRGLLAINVIVKFMSECEDDEETVSKK